MFGLLNIAIVWGDYYARLRQYRKKNQSDFLFLSKITKESVKVRFSKNWRQRSDIQTRYVCCFFLLHFATIKINTGKTLYALLL